MKSIPPVTRASVRKDVLWLHRWLGLIVGLYFTVLGLTGSILVYRGALDARAMPETVHAAPPSPGARPLPLSAIEERLRAQFPRAGAMDLGNIQMPAEPGGAYTIELQSAKPNGDRLVTVDPYTGRALRNVRKAATLTGFARSLHADLLNGPAGRQVNGYGALAVAAMLLLGLWLWWPATLRQARIRLTVKRGADRRRAMSDWHNVVGAYALPLLLSSVLTGAMFVYFQPVQKMVYAITRTPADPKPAVITAPPNAHRLSVDALTDVAERTVPDSRLLFIMDVRAPGVPFRAVKMSSKTGFLRYVVMAVDPYTGKVVQMRDDRTTTQGMRLLQAAGSLHFGGWGGAVTQALYCLLGLTPLCLYITGISMYLVRRRSGRRANARPSEIESAVPAGIR